MPGTWHLFTRTLVLHVHMWYLFTCMLVIRVRALGARSIREARPSRTWEIPPHVAWSVVAMTTVQVLNRRYKHSKTIMWLVEACYACNT